MTSGKQIAAARALLGWTQAELSKQSGVSITSVQRLEKEFGDSTSEVKNSVLEALRKAGVSFIDDGLQLKTTNYEIFDGPDCYLRILDDIFYTLKDTKGEALFYCSDDRLSNEITVSKERFLRRSGIKMRCIIEEDNTFIRYPLNEYRYIPKRYFNNHLTVIYGNKVALLFDINEKSFILENRLYAENQRNQFELIWSLHKQPKSTTFKETIDG